MFNLNLALVFIAVYLDFWTDTFRLWIFHFLLCLVFLEISGFLTGKISSMFASLFLTLFAVRCRQIVLSIPQAIYSGFIKAPSLKAAT